MLRRAGTVSGASSRSSGTPPLEGGGRSQFGHNHNFRAVRRRSPGASCCRHNDSAVHYPVGELGRKPRGSVRNLLRIAPAGRTSMEIKGDSYAEDLRVRRSGGQETARADQHRSPSTRPPRRPHRHPLLRRLSQRPPPGPGRVGRRGVPDGTRARDRRPRRAGRDRKSTRLNSSHSSTSYTVFCLKKKKKNTAHTPATKKERKHEF